MYQRILRKLALYLLFYCFPQGLSEEETRQKRSRFLKYWAVCQFLIVYYSYSLCSFVEISRIFIPTKINIVSMALLPNDW
jgi:hypothetical protein